MAERKTRVEIIPWGHNINSLSHEDVINYIKQLPKNSYLAMELSPWEEPLYIKVMDVLKGQKPKEALGYGGKVERKYLPVLKEWSGLPLEKIKKEFPGRIWATIEALHECWKRNIKVIPIETQVSKEHVEKAQRAARLGKHYIETAADKFREKTQAGIIQTSLKKIKAEKLPVLVGMGHVPHLQKRLADRGINAKINLKLFLRRDEIGFVLEAAKDRRERLVSWADMPESLLILALESDKRREDPEKVKDRIVRELREKEKMQIVRAEWGLERKKRKLERKKRKIARVRKRRA